MSDRSTMSKDEWAFIYLLLGLQSYLEDKGRLEIPPNLRRAMNLLSLAMADQFPKTISGFMGRCSQPLVGWCPLELPDTFNQSQPLLYDGELSEEAKDYLLQLNERIALTPAMRLNLPRIVLDNLIMRDLITRLKADTDTEAAQQLYVKVRSFLIENSWVTAEKLQAQDQRVFMELREFYEELPRSTGAIYVCERCGILEWRDDRLYGVKPAVCSDHATDSPLIIKIINETRVLRMRRGAQRQTFLPGRLELKIFTIVEELEARYPDFIVAVERYPAIDTYDLRVEFVDGTVWAVDAKDHQDAKLLSTEIKPLYNEGRLAHQYAFYVIPDERFDEVDYRETLEYNSDFLPRNTEIIPVSIFQQRLEYKVNMLATPVKKKKGK